MLYLVPTPIGNLDDMTLRAIKILKEVDLILAEDTRSSGHLLKHFDIQTPMKSYHAHNEHGITEHLIKQLKDGLNLALITDAGTPAISDPGFYLVRACHDADIPVSCLPGPSALIPALAMSGIPCNRFYFEGFLPHKKGRQTRLKFLATLQCTIALYESPYRLLKLLNEISEFLGPERQVAIIKEISKIYETIFRGNPKELSEQLNKSNLKGEFVVIIGTNSKQE